MNYQETIEYLFASQPAFHMIGAAAYKPGFDNTIKLMDALEHPENKFKSVHIAGTNGKGSTSHLIAASLQAAGLKVGLYTSPHLVDFRERIRINGQMISEQAVVDFVSKMRPLLDTIKPSFFESTMALAFDYFAREQVDIAVIEVGLGGRLDSTNIITPLLSVITNIGMDHTEFLGDTLAKIASEKAGIIKPNVPCVIGESNQETDPVFIAKAKECNIWGDGQETTNCKIWFADKSGYMNSRRRRTITECQLHGSYQEHNMQTAYVALTVLMNLPIRHTPLSEGGFGNTITTYAIQKGFANVVTMTGLRGRWETLEQSPLTICDTGHNSHGIKYVAEQLRHLHAQHQGTLRIVLGMVNDKDVNEVMRLLPEDAVYYFTEADTHRAIPAEEMKRKWIAIHPDWKGISHIYNNTLNAFNAIQRDKVDKDIIFYGGSNYIVGEIQKYYSIK